MLVENESGKQWNSGYNNFIYPTAKKFVILLFTMENSNFFYDVLIENKIKIDFLTHINDGGGSMGGSSKKMNFMYLYTETLGLKHIILDNTLKNIEYSFNQWEKHHYFNPKAKRGPLIRKKTEINLYDWDETKIFFPYSSGIFIKTKWDTGHHYWDYSYFDKSPGTINESHAKNNRVIGYGRYIQEYNHYVKK